MICLSFHGAEFCQSEWEWSTCFMIDPCLIGQSAVFIGVNCDIYMIQTKELLFVFCAGLFLGWEQWPTRVLPSQWSCQKTSAGAWPWNTAARKPNRLFLYSKTVHVDSHKHIVIPQGGRDDMIQASFCPSETSVCHILVTRCVQRCQGCKYNVRTCL